MIYVLSATKCEGDAGRAHAGVTVFRYYTLFYSMLGTWKQSKAQKLMSGDEGIITIVT